MNKSLTYIERSHIMTCEVRKEAALAGERLFLKANKTMLDAQIDTINTLREAGEQFNIASGRNQLLFNLEGAEFCRKEILPLLKSGMGLNEIKACVHIARHVKQPIQNAEELGSIKSELQMSLRILGLIDRSHHEGQTLVERNLFCTIATAARKFELLFEDLEKEKPKDEWTIEALDEILESAKPIKKRIAELEEMRASKGV